jgi:peptidoglycan hydrolase-like protein with peptidoglycan-binding domain
LCIITGIVDLAARSSSRRTEQAAPAFEEEVVGDGLMARLVDRVIDNPAMSGGLVVMALTAAAVVSNAVFLQKARHPEPWFMTRPAAVDSSTPAGAPDEIPTPRPRAEAPALQPPPPPANVAIPVPEPAPASHQTGPEKSVITELQKELAGRGLYDGKIDGISGSRTRAAIVAFEKSEGLPVTGEPSPQVLDQIKTASIQSPEPAAGPRPATASPPPQAVERLAPQPVKAVTSRPLDDGPAGVADPVASEIEIATRNRYLAVQHALNQIGYGPVAEDGRANDDVENAIRRFELDNALPITGTPDDSVVDRLVSIGAMEAT